MRRALFLLALAIVVVAVGLAGGFVLYRHEQSRNVRGSSTVEFVATEPVAPPRTRKLASVPWATYGYDAARLRFANGIRLRPPFRKLWVAGGVSLLEFPPAVGFGRLYLSNNAGLFIALYARSGSRAWSHQTGRCVAASPAIHDRTVFEAFMNRHPCNATNPNLEGEVIAFDVGSGKIRWRTRIGPSETSPLVANGLVYVGDWRGNVYALDERTGHVRWTFHTGGRVKGGVALSGKRIYVGSYDGHVYALRARTGKLIWRASAQQRLAGRGTFYSTPAVAYGRVYLGSTDGKVYSFGAHSGKLRWSYGTGGYVYASPAVWRRRVYAGSYSGRFYAFDAATGDVRWTFRANGPISGSATVIDGVVYFATLKNRTYGLDARTGRLLWSFPDGTYSPIVADRDRLYLVGYASVYGLAPRGAKAPLVGAASRTGGLRPHVRLRSRPGRPNSSKPR